MRRKRLQVVIDGAELQQYEEAGRAGRLTLSAWVRQVLRTAARDVNTGQVDLRLAALADAYAHSFPARDIDEMLSDIERGYVGSAGP